MPQPNTENRCEAHPGRKAFEKIEGAWCCPTCILQCTCPNCGEKQYGRTGTPRTTEHLRNVSWHNRRIQMREVIDEFEVTCSYCEHTWVAS